MSTRPRPTSTLPKSPVSLHPTSIIDAHAVLTGTHLITIGPSAILHPRSRIYSTYLPITISSGCIIHSRAIIGLTDPSSLNPSSPDPSSLDELSSITLGPNVVVEPGAIVAAAEVGEGSVIGAGAEVGAGAVLGRGCRVGPRCKVGRGEVLDDGTVVYGEGRGERRVQRGGEVERLRGFVHEKQLEGLRRLIKSDLVKHGGASAPAGEQGVATASG